MALNANIHWGYILRVNVPQPIAEAGWKFLLANARHDFNFDGEIIGLDGHREIYDRLVEWGFRPPETGPDADFAFADKSGAVGTNWLEYVHIKAMDPTETKLRKGFGGWKLRNSDVFSVYSDDGISLKKYESVMWFSDFTEKDAQQVAIAVDGLVDDSVLNSVLDDYWLFIDWKVQALATQEDKACMKYTEYLTCYDEDDLVTPTITTTSHKIDVVFDLQELRWVASSEPYDNEETVIEFDDLPDKQVAAEKIALRFLTYYIDQLDDEKAMLAALKNEPKAHLLLRRAILEQRIYLTKNVLNKNWLKLKLYFMVH